MRVTEAKGNITVCKNVPPVRLQLARGVLCFVFFRNFLLGLVRSVLAKDAVIGRELGKWVVSQSG